MIAKIDKHNRVIYIYTSRLLRTNKIHRIRVRFVLSHSADSGAIFRSTRFGGTISSVVRDFQTGQKKKDVRVEKELKLEWKGEFPGGYQAAMAPAI